MPVVLHAEGLPPGAGPRHSVKLSSLLQRLLKDKSHEEDDEEHKEEKGKSWTERPHVFLPQTVAGLDQRHTGWSPAGWYTQPLGPQPSLHTCVHLGE